MSELIQIKDKFYKEHQLIHLHTNDVYAEFCIYLKTNKLSTNTDLLEHHFNQHLYLLSDEDIKENDFYISYAVNRRQDLTRTIKICSNKNYENPEVLRVENKIHFAGHRKIIATTNKKITIDHYDSDSYGIPQKLNLPSFEKDFLKIYCALDGIDKVLVEYRNFSHWEDAEVFEKYVSDIRLYKSSDNFINIKTTKTNYSREEVLQMMHECWLQATAKTLEPLTEKGFTSFMYEKYLL